MWEDVWPCLVDRTYDVLRTIDEWSTDDLNIASCKRRVLNYKSCHILINVSTKDCLNHEDMSMSVDCLNYTEIIYISIVIEVEV